MKKTQAPKNLISCALLMLGSICSLEAATLTVKVKDSYGQPLGGVAVQWVTSGFNTLGTTDANGLVTGTITNNVNFKIKLTYANTAYQTLVAKNSGTATTLDSFNTSELKFVTKCGGQPVSGIGVQYMNGYPTGSWIQAGSTDVNGEKSVQVFPFDNMNVRATANGSLETRTIASFPYGTVQYVEQFNNLIKLQSPGASFLVAGSWVPGSTGKYIFPGAYQVRINNIYLSNLTLAGALFDMVPIVIVVKDHNNNPTPGAALRGGYGAIPNGGGFGWHATPTDADGITVDWTNPGSNIRSYEAKVNGTTAAQTKDINLTGGNVFLFKTNELTLKLLNCSGGGVAGGSARYGIGANYSTWYVPGANSTNGSGITTMEAFPGTYSFEMRINQSTEVKQIVFTGTNCLTWTTTKVAFTWPYAVAYGGDGNAAFFPDKAGTEMLPGTWNFRFDAPGGSIIAPMSVSGCSTSKSAVILRLIKSTGTPIANAQPSIYQNGWIAMPLTNAAGNSVILIDGNPGSTYTAMNYQGGQQVIVQDVSASPIVTYQTKLVTIDFKTSTNSHSLQGENLAFYSDQWRTFGTGTTTNGLETMELLPLNYYFSLTYQGGAETKTQDVSSNQTVQFQTRLVTFDFTNSSSQHTLQGQNLAFYSDQWRTFGSGMTSAGVETMELLPLSYYFSLAYEGATNTVVQNVASNQTASFQTKLVTIDFTNSLAQHALQGEGLSFYSDHWRTFGSGTTNAGVETMELLPANYYFSLTYLGGSQSKVQDVTTNQTVPFQTNLVKFDFKNSFNLHTLEGENLAFYSDTWRTFGSGTTNSGVEAMELLPLSYYFSLSYKGATESKQQTIASNQTIPFQTTLVTIKARDESDNALFGENLQFYSDTWRTFGSGITIAGNEVMELLPQGYYFSLTYSGNAFVKNQNVGVSPLLSYIFGSGGNLLRKTNNATTVAVVSYYPNPAINNVVISMPAAGTVEIHSIDGKTLGRYEVSEGSTSVDVSTLPAGNHIMIVDYDGKHETYKFVKQ